MNQINKKYIIFLIILFLTTSSFFGVGIYFLSKAKQKSNDFYLAKNKFFSTEKTESQLELAKNFYEKHQGEVKEFNAVFFETDVPVKLITFIEETASTSGVNFNLDSIGKANLGDNQGFKIFKPALIMSASASASLKDILLFLTKIESGPFLIEVTDITIRKKGFDSDKSSTSSVDVHFTLKVFNK
jgi:hypothetical protein